MNASNAISRATENHKLRSALCKVCENQKLKLLYEIRGYKIFQCAYCGFGQVFINIETLASFYDQQYFDGGKACFSQTESSVADRAHKFWLTKQIGDLALSPKFSILEIGPGVGGALAEEIRTQWPSAKYEAIEISQYATESLRKRGFTLHCGRVDSTDFLNSCQGKFDLVIGTEVIEHDPEPIAFINSVRHVLKRGGRCAFTTGNLAGMTARVKRAEWYYLDPPAHVSYFTPKSARYLFAKTGFYEFRVEKVGFNYIELQLKHRIPGFSFLIDKLSVPTGMTIGATKA